MNNPEIFKSTNNFIQWANKNLKEQNIELCIPKIFINRRI